MRAYRRPSDAIQTGVQTGAQTPFRRYAGGIQTDYSHTPHTPLALRAPFWGLWGPPGRLSARSEGFAVSVAPQKARPPFSVTCGVRSRLGRIQAAAAVDRQSRMATEIRLLAREKSAREAAGWLKLGYGRLQPTLGGAG